MATLYIVRGLPGSGKSTVAKKLVKVERHRETDMYFITDGQYQFNPKLIKVAHEWCKKEIRNLMETEQSDCAVSNTFTQRWEYQPYIELAKKCGYTISIVECHGTWKNIHNVPDDVIAQMKNRWEHHIV